MRLATTSSPAEHSVSRVLLTAAMPEDITCADSPSSILASASARNRLEGFQCREYRKQPSISCSKASSIRAGLWKVNVEESVIEGFTSPNSPRTR